MNTWLFKLRSGTVICLNGIFNACGVICLLDCHEGMDVSRLVFYYCYLGPGNVVVHVESR